MLNIVLMLSYTLQHIYVYSAIVSFHEVAQKRPRKSDSPKGCAADPDAAHAIIISLLQALPSKNIVLTQKLCVAFCVSVLCAYVQANTTTFLLQALGL